MTARDAERKPKGMTAPAASHGIVSDGEGSWPLWLFELVDDLRKRRDAELIVEPPAPGLGVRMRALVASTVEPLCAELHLPVPEWCWETAALAEPWFVAGLEDLKVMALVESPVWFRRRNVFVLGNFLSRA